MTWPATDKSNPQIRHLERTVPSASVVRVSARQRRWRMVNAPHLVALVRAGATFVNGKLAERPGEDAPPQAA